MIEHRIDITTPDGVMPAFEFYPSEGGPHPVVFYLMDAPSIRPALRDMASRLASAGYYVLLPFLYYRGSPYREFGTSDEDMHLRRDLMQSVTREGMLRDARGMLAHASQNENARVDGPKGAVGLCMSGPLVLALAQAMPEDFPAVASIHGAWLVTDDEDSPHRCVDQIQGEVYFGWAEDDPLATPDDLKVIKRALEQAGVRHTIDYFEGAVHGFAPPGSERYHRHASETQWARVHALLRRRLG